MTDTTGVRPVDSPTEPGLPTCGGMADPAPPDTMSNINGPGGEPPGACWTKSATDTSGAFERAPVTPTVSMASPPATRGCASWDSSC